MAKQLFETSSKTRVVFISSIMSQRLHYRTRNSYNTKSNKTKAVKTPGGKLTLLYRTKRPGVPRCGDTGVPLNGIPALRPNKYAGLSKNKKRVNRAYGGSRSAGAVRDRILRSFLLEEQKCVKKMLKEKPTPSTTEKAEQKVEKVEKKSTQPAQKKEQKKKTK
jgi:large subunit ribosomal protein L34e